MKMQIFAVDKCPITAAQALCDTHVISQIKESAQILSAVAHLKGYWEPWMYKPAWLKHPAVLWTAESEANLRWLVAHGVALSMEYWYRYGQHKKPPVQHKSKKVIDGFCVRLQVPYYKWEGYSTFVQAFKEEDCAHRADPIQGYREYYHTKKFAKWKNGRKPPTWWRGHDNT